MINKINVLKNILKKIFFGIFLFLVFQNLSFGYYCPDSEINLNSKKIFLKSNEGDIYILNIFKNELLPHNETNCTNIDQGWDATGENCTFTGQTILKLLKIKDNFNFEDQNSCPYEKLSDSTKNLTSTGGNIGFNRDLKIPNSDATLMKALDNFQNSENEISNISIENNEYNIFLFGGKIDGKINKTSIEIILDNNSIVSSKVSNLSYDNIQTIERNFISSSGGTLDAKLDGNGCFGNKTEDENQKCNTDINTFTGSIKSIFRSDAFVGKYGNKYAIIGGKYINSSGNDEYLNNILIYDPTSTGSTVGFGTGQFLQLDIGNIGNYNIIGGTIDTGNSSIYGIFQNETNLGEIQIKKYNTSEKKFNNITNGEILLGEKKHYSKIKLNCKNNECKVVIVGGSNKEKTVFLDPSITDKEIITSPAPSFLNKILIKNLSNNTSNGYILNKNIFGYKDLQGNIKPYGVINSDFFIDKNNNIIIDKYTNLKGNFEKAVENSCNYSDDNNFELNKNKDNFIFIKNNDFEKGYKINYTSTEINNDIVQNLPDGIKNGYNNIIQYDNSGVGSISKNFISCYYQEKMSPTKNVKNGILTYKQSVPAATHDWYLSQKNRLQNRSGMYITGQSFLPINIKSGFGNNDKVKLLPIQTINNKIYFGGNFEFGSGRYLNTYFKDENDDFNGFNQDEIDKFIDISPRRIFHGIDLTLTVSGTLATDTTLTQYLIEKNATITNVEYGNICTRTTPPKTVWRKNEDGSNSNQIEREYKFSGKTADGKQIWISSQCENPIAGIPKISFGNETDSENEGLATLLGNNLTPITNNGNVSSGSFLFAKKFTPGFHRVHMIISMENNNGFNKNDIIKAAEINGLGGVPLTSLNDFQGFSRDINHYTISDLGSDITDINTIPKSLDINYQAYTYEFYVPEITNLKKNSYEDLYKIGGVNPSFTGKYVPKDSQLFFYSGDENKTFRINDISKNYPITNTGFSIDNFSGAILQVDNSKLHHKIRPSSDGSFNYSPVLKFPKTDKSYLKYFYIDSKGNIIGGDTKEFKVGTGTVIIYNNKTNKDLEIETDSIKPFISGNYLSDFTLNGTISDLNGEFQVSVIKTDLEGNFTFQPQKNLEIGKKYFLSFGNGQTQNIKILNTKKIPEIVSHKNGEIEVANYPIFYGNGKAGEDIIIEVSTEDQSDQNHKFNDINCKNILDSNGINSNLNGGNAFSGTIIYSCSDLGELGKIGEIGQFKQTKEIKVNTNGNWTWQLDKKLENTPDNLDSKNIYFIKTYYKDNPSDYDLISFRYFPKQNIVGYKDEFKNDDINYIERNGDKLEIKLNKENSKLDIFEKSEIEIKKTTPTTNNFSIEIPAFGGIKFLEDLNNVNIERGIWIYNNKEGKLKLNQKTQNLDFLKGDKIFLGSKKSKINFLSDVKFFSYGKIKILNNLEKILIEIPENIKIFLENLDKINSGFYDEIEKYLTENTPSKYGSNGNEDWYSIKDNNGKLEEYNKNIQTIFNTDDTSSNKNFRISDSFNGKIIKEGEKILLKGTAWINSKIKISIENKTIGSTSTDGSGTFLFYIPKSFEYKNQGLHPNNTIGIRIDNNEERNLSKELLITISKNQTGSYLNSSSISNKNRNFKKENGFINFSERIKKLPVFNW